MSDIIINRKYLVAFLLLFILQPRTSLAVLDFLASRAEEAAKTSMYMDAVYDLFSEVVPDSSMERVSRELRDENQKLSSEMYDLHFLGEDIKGLLDGPDVVGPRLDENLRSTTNYLRRGKRVAMQLALLGSNGLTAMNGLQTNATLLEIQKNQATLIAQNQKKEIYQARQEIKDSRDWQNFVKKQRNYRNATLYHSGSGSGFGQLR